MASSRRDEYPPKLVRQYRRAQKLAWLTTAYLLTAVLRFLVMGPVAGHENRLAEDTLGLVAPGAFLVPSRLFWRPANREFPYGSTGWCPSPTGAGRWRCSWASTCWAAPW